jgi:peptide/nickel transport system permease protein
VSGLGGYLTRRLGTSLLTLLAASMLVFGMVHALPGGPAQALAAGSNDPRVIAAIEHKYQLDQPLVTQYWHWLTLAVRGDLGRSPLTDLPVSGELVNRVPVTLELALLGLLVALAIGLPAGVLAARRPGGVFDLAAGGLALAGLSIPHFWFGILLILLFSVHWHLLPAAGTAPIVADPVGNLTHLAMPALVLGVGFGAVLMRQVRAAMLTALGQDYIRTARAKGAPEWAVVGVHALRNCLVIVVTVLGLQVSALLTGVVTVEQVFDIPGLGKLTLDSVFQRDYPTLQGVVLLTAAALITVNLLVDVAYSLANPRIRVGGGSR